MWRGLYNIIKQMNRYYLFQWKVHFTMCVVVLRIWNETGPIVVYVVYSIYVAVGISSKN